MQFNLTFILRGPAGIVEAPNVHNPVTADDLASLLAGVIEIMPRDTQLGLDTIGLRVDPVLPPTTPPTTTGT